MSLENRKKIQGLYAVLCSLPIARMAIQGGVDIIQFRYKELYTPKIIETAQEIRLLCRKAQIPFIVNDHCDIALKLDADGVHLGQSDLPIPDARSILGPYAIIGGTASTVEEALAMEAAGADYIGLGHIFPTISKQKNYPPIGLETVKKVKEKLKIPLIAIGGISEKNICSVLAQGADGIAVISAITHANDPVAATKQLKQAFRNGNIFKANATA